MTKNTASQKIGAQMVTAADGSAFTSAVTVAVTLDAGTQATGSVGSGACTHEGNGYHTYAPSQAETNGTLLAFTFTGTGAVPTTVQVFTTGFDKTQTAVAAALTATSVDTIWDEAYSGHTTSGTYGDKFGAHLPAVLKALTTAGGSTTTIVLNATTGVDGGVPSASNDFYNGRVFIFTSGALAGQATSISDYVGSTQTLTVVAMTGTPASGVTGVIV